ncbi:MAG: TIGR04283 family arsenosugar biosynthesis glycosyltransferase [Akkermansiaceae bacterium]
MTSASQVDISIIIPVLNESENLERCLASLPADFNVDVIVCDGGSADDSLEIAQQSGASVVSSDRGRAQQMNAGARVALGDILLFLHADTLLPENAIASIRRAVKDEFSMGCFERVFDTPHPLLRYTSKCAGWRARKFFLAYGDQAIFIRRDLFEKLDGYRLMRRFEDMDLALRAKKHGRWIVLPDTVTTDARRFGKSPIKRVLKDAWLTVAWLIGLIKE